MNIKDNETSILIQSHEMNAEGTCDLKPTQEEIEYYLNTKGFLSKDVEVFYDYMMNCWRWYCSIDNK